MRERVRPLVAYLCELFSPTAWYETAIVRTPNEVPRSSHKLSLMVFCKGMGEKEEDVQHSFPECAHRSVV